MDMISSCSHPTALLYVAVLGQKFYVAGYNTPIPNVVQHVYEYDVSTNCWDRLPILGQY